MTIDRAHQAAAFMGRGRRSPRLAAALSVGLTLALLLGCSSSKKSTSSSSSASTSSKPPVTTAADRLLQAGLQAEGQGNLNLAKEDYAAVIAADPLNKFAYYDLGVINQQEGDVTDASDDYGRALQIDPNFPSALFNLAVLDTPLSPASSITLYQKLISINPKDANSLFNLGLLLKSKGQTAAGSEDIAAAISIDHSLASRLGTTTTTR